MINSSQLLWKLHSPSVRPLESSTSFATRTRAQTVDVADMFAKMTEVAAATMAEEEEEGDANATLYPDTPHTFLWHGWHCTESTL